MTDPRDRTAVTEHRRLEALRRLGPYEPDDRADLSSLLEVVAAAVGARTVALTLVDGDQAHEIAATEADVVVSLPRARSFAGQVVEAGGPRSALADADGSLRDHPHLQGLTLPVRYAAVPVRAPKGEEVGALEVIWPDDREVDGQAWAALASAAHHAEHLLELRAEVAEYRRFVELAPDAVLILDADGDVELANPALCTVLDFEHPDEVIGRPFLELVAPEDRTRVTAELGRVQFARRRKVRLDVQLVGRDGAQVSCSISAGHLRGPRRHLQLVVHDLTDRLRDEAERTQLSEQLARAQRLDAVGQVASGLAHDLNNLLVVMTSNLSLAEESLEDLSGEASEASLEHVRYDLRELRTAVGRANDLTAKLLQFAREGEGEHDNADVVEVLDAVQGLVGRSLGDGVDLDVHLPPALPLVAADPVELERVLLNLVINARDAVEGDGAITVSARTVSPGHDRDRRDRRRPSETIDTGQEFVRIDVIDDGIGMDEVTRARAFEPLWSSKGPDGGTGLGLATVASFADDVDGSVDLVSEQGSGTRVVMHVPVADQPAAEVPIGMDIPVAGARVVLLEPGERTRRIISRMLQAAGYRVRAFGTHDEALEALRSDGAELFVTELSLPGTSGPVVLESAQEIVPGIGVVVITSVDGPRTLDGTPLLVKPFSHERLLRAAKRVLAEG